MLDAAVEELVESGVASATMASIAPSTDSSSGDWQIAGLLGEAPPDDQAVLERARIAVDQFLVLYAQRG